MAKKPFHLIAIVISLILYDTASMAEDKFGQEVDMRLEEKVLKARQMRLPYQADVYDPEKSARLLKEVISEKPDYYRAHFNLGLAYHELGDYENAIDTFDTALSIREEQEINDFTLVNTAGWVSLKNGDLERAESLLLLAAELTKGTGTYTEGAVYGNLGELYFLTQRFDDAREHLYVARDQFGSKGADYYLDLMDRTEKVLERQKIQAN